VPTIDGNVKCTVPEGTDTHTVFRLKGKGIQHLNRRGRGDQFVRVIIETPKNLTKAQKEKLRLFDESVAEKYTEHNSFFDKVKKLFT
jgi:molecular chaperone DnaJ